MRWVAFLALLFLPLAAGQYKYVFYDGDEAEYEDFNQTDPERVEVEVNEEDYGGYYDYDYTKDRNTEDEVEEYSEGEDPEEEDYVENEDTEEREDNGEHNNEDDEYGEGEGDQREQEEDYNEGDEEDGEDGDYEGGDEYEDDYEEESTDEDTEQLYRNYEILSEFYQKHFVDLRILDESCDGEVRPAPTINHGSVAQYLLVGFAVKLCNHHGIIRTNY